MPREPFKLWEQTEFLGQDMDSARDQIAKGYVRRLVDLEPEGGSVRERDPLDKYVITWPEAYSGSIVHVARGRFFDELYPEVIFAVDSSGYLYYLEVGTGEEDYEARELQAFWSQPIYMESVQFIDKVILTDGNLMVAAWAKDGTVNAEPLQNRPHPGVPRFDSEWDSGSYESEVPDWVTQREYATISAVRYVLTYVWEDGSEGPPGPTSEAYTLPAFEWDAWYNRPVRVELPSVGYGLDPQPKNFRIYRAWSTSMGGVGDIGWQGFYEIAEVPIRSGTWMDTFTTAQEGGQGLPPAILSSVPVGKHLDVAADSRRLLIGNVKETNDQQPEPGYPPWDRFGSSGYLPQAGFFAKRLVIDVGVRTEVVACNESIKIRLQNTNASVHDALSAIGACVPIEDFTALWDHGNWSLSEIHNLRFVVTDMDGITVLPYHVSWGGENYLELVMQLPEILPGVSKRLYLYYDADQTHYRNRSQMALYFGARRPARSNELFRMNGGLWPVNPADNRLNRPACSAPGVGLAYLDLFGGGVHVLGAGDVYHPEITTSVDIPETYRLNKTRRTLTFDRDTLGNYWVYTTDGGTQIADLSSGSCSFWLVGLDGAMEVAKQQELFAVYDPAGAGAYRVRVSVELPAVGGDLRFRIGVDSPPAIAVTLDVPVATYLFATVDWAALEGTAILRLWVPGDSPFEETDAHEATHTVAAFSNMANVEARFLYRDPGVGVSPDPFPGRIGDVMMTTERLTLQEELWEANMEPYGAMVTVDPEPEEIGVPEHYPNRGRYCESEDAQSWDPEGYRDIGSEDHPINLVAVYERNVGWCKADGIYPMYLGSGAQLEFTDEGVLSETVFWNPQTLASDKRGYAGCASPGGGMATPDGVYLWSGNALIRWDGQKVWDHTDGMRTQLIASQTWRTESPIIFFWEPVRQNLMVAWKQMSVWRVAGIRQSFVRGQKSWGWFEHKGYQPLVVCRSPGVASGRLLLSNGTDLYYFDQNLENDAYGSRNPEIELPTIRLVRGNVKGFGVSFSHDDIMRASLFLDGQAAHTFQSIISDRQYSVRVANCSTMTLKLYGGDL